MWTIAHFEKNNKTKHLNVLNWGPGQHTLKKIFKVR